jgi:two-component system response regulator DesR
MVVTAPLGNDPHVDRLRILIVDDDEAYAEALMTLFGGDERLDAVGVATDGAQAVRLAGELKPDIVLMDVGLPVLDGIEATRQIREADPSIRVIVMTSASAGDLPEGAREAGATAFLTKDQDYPQLLEATFAVATLAIALSSNGPTPRS